MTSSPYDFDPDIEQDDRIQFTELGKQQAIKDICFRMLQNGESMERIKLYLNIDEQQFNEFSKQYYQLEDENEKVQREQTVKCKEQIIKDLISKGIDVEDISIITGKSEDELQENIDANK